MPLRQKPRHLHGLAVSIHPSRAPGGSPSDKTISRPPSLHRRRKWGKRSQLKISLNQVLHITPHNLLLLHHHLDHHHVSFPLTSSPFTMNHPTTQLYLKTRMTKSLKPWNIQQLHGMTRLMIRLCHMPSQPQITPHIRSSHRLSL